MQYWRCECGESEYFESGMPPHDCQGCDKCGTTYARQPGNHRPRIPHDPKPQFNRGTGEPDRPVCRRCGKRLAMNTQEEKDAT